MPPQKLDLEIRRLRGDRASVDPQRPNAAFVEIEPIALGRPVAAATLLLAVAECPLACAMCDLWQRTLTRPTPEGAVGRQIDWALEHLQATGRVQSRHGLHTIKLYNSGSFFDPRSIPPADYAAIAGRLGGFQRVVVENHPRFGHSRLRRFTELLGPELEVAVGLETVQPGMLRRLNKRMRRDDFDRFAVMLRDLRVGLRVFLMLGPPWNRFREAVNWTRLSVRHAVRAGARHITIIPARSGNGWMEQQQHRGAFAPPSLEMLAEALELAQHDVARFGSDCVVTADLWDVGERTSDALQRLTTRNRTGRVESLGEDAGGDRGS